MPLRPPADFEPLFAAVAGTAYGIAARLTRNQADAEDLVQEAALLAFRAFASFEPGTNFRAWFFKILTNCYFSKRRREKTRPVTSDFDDTPDLYLYARSGEAGFPTQGPDPAAQLLDQLGTERVVAAIARLPEEYGVVSYGEDGSVTVRTDSTGWDVTDEPGGGRSDVVNALHGALNSTQIDPSSREQDNGNVFYNEFSGPYNTRYDLIQAEGKREEGK